jgi:predicted Zn-dependent peptidase
MISTEAGREVCEATIREVHHEMKRLREEEIPDDELMMVRNYLMGTILGDLDGPFQIIGRWKNLILNDLDGQFFYDTLKTIREITPQELNALAVKYLREEEFYELTVV